MARRVHEFTVDPGVLDAVCAEGMDPGQLQWLSEVVTTRTQMFALVHEAIEALPTPYRDVIEGCFWERCSYDELASRLGCAHRSTVMRWKREAIARLQDQLRRTTCPMLWTQYCSVVRPQPRSEGSPTS